MRVHVLVPSLCNPQPAVIGAGINDIRVARGFGERGAAAIFSEGDLGGSNLQIVAACDRAEDVITRRVENMGIEMR